MKREVNQLDFNRFLEDTLEKELIVNDINARRDLTRYERIYNYLERKRFLLKLKLVRMKIKRLESEENKALIRKKSN
jgi:hypothetical protein